MVTKLTFYGTGGLGTAVFLYSVISHSAIASNVGLVLLTICVILGLFSKER
jgi:hypothetical protein